MVLLLDGSVRRARSRKLKAACIGPYEVLRIEGPDLVLRTRLSKELKISTSRAKLFFRMIADVGLTINGVARGIALDGRVEPIYVLGVSKSSRNILIKTITSYLDLILHHHLQSSPLGSAYTDPSVSATFEMRPGSLSLLGCLVPSAFPLEFPQL
jgi:hypothetical protein